MEKIQVGASASQSLALRTGPFSGTSGAFNVGGSGAGSGSMPAQIATNWALIASIAAAGLVVIVIAALWFRRK